MKNEMKEKLVGQAWEETWKNTTTNLKKEDILIIQSFSKMVGQTDIEGQVSQIELIEDFLDTQLKQAEEEKKKNEKMYRTLGVVTGSMLVIVLI